MNNNGTFRPDPFKGFVHTTDKFTPPRDRTVKVRSVPCPVCDAPTSQGCVKTNGQLSTSTHLERRRMAIRAHNATGDTP